MTAPAQEPSATGIADTGSPRFVLTNARDHFTIDIVARALAKEPMRPEQIRRLGFPARIAIYAGLAAAIGAGGAWYFERTAVASAPATALGGILGALVGVALAHALLNERRRKIDRAISAHVGHFRAAALQAGAMRIEVLDAGVRVHSGMGMYICTWLGVRGVRELESVPVLELWPDVMIPLWPASFRSAEEREAFLEFARAKIAPRGGGEAGLLRRILATHPARCPACRYALQGCDGANCPECGLRLTLALLGLPTPNAIADLKLGPAAPVQTDDR